MWTLVQLIYYRARMTYRRRRDDADMEVRDLRRLLEHQVEYEREAVKLRGAGASEDELQRLDKLKFYIGLKFEDEVAATQTRRLLSQARKFGVPVPPLSDKEAWIQATERSRNVLCDQVMDDLRRKVSAARREWMESASKVAGTFVPIVTGILGLLLGLLLKGAGAPR